MYLLIMSTLALGKIGVVTEEITDCLLWAVRYEEKPGVRAEACHTIKTLRILTELVAEVLQDRCLVESSQMVRDEIMSALKMFDISTSEDMDMVAQVKKEVRRLTTRNIIASQITLNEQEADEQENLKRMIYQSEEDVKERDAKKVSTMERLRTISGAGSRKSKLSSSVPSTPDAGRDFMVFTPTAEQELEAIMSKYDVSSGDMESVTPRPKSTATSASSRDDGTDSDDEEGSKSDAGTPRDRTSSRLSTRGTGRSEGDEEDGESKALERPTSTVRFSSHLHIANIERSGSRADSLLDDEDRAVKSRTSSAVTAATDGLAFGREAIAEREKINAEAKNTFAVMDMRYRDMVEDLIDLDNTFELGLMSGSRQDFERKIQNVRIIKTPPSRPQDLPRIELTVDEVEPVEGQEEEVDETGNQSVVVVVSESVNQAVIVNETVDHSTSGDKQAVKSTGDEQPVDQATSENINAGTGVIEPGKCEGDQSVEGSDSMHLPDQNVVNVDLAAMTQSTDSANTSKLVSQSDTSEAVV